MDDSAFTVNVTVIELLTMQSAIVLKTKLKHGVQQLGILSLLDFSNKVSTEHKQTSDACCQYCAGVIQNITVQHCVLLILSMPRYNITPMSILDISST